MASRIAGHRGEVTHPVATDIPFCRQVILERVVPELQCLGPNSSQHTGSLDQPPEHRLGLREVPAWTLTKPLGDKGDRPLLFDDRNLPLHHLTSQALNEHLLLVVSQLPIGGGKLGEVQVTLAVALQQDLAESLDHLVLPAGKFLLSVPVQGTDHGSQ